jgi:hypothetical protein
MGLATLDLASADWSSSAATPQLDRQVITEARIGIENVHGALAIGSGNSLRVGARQERLVHASMKFVVSRTAPTAGSSRISSMPSRQASVADARHRDWPRMTPLTRADGKLSTSSM